ncbi:heme-dependent oxidative N-demethylase family protein [Puniceibacterium sediminis]|uniref:DUF3445 domain-containing protein n=1 Tax=Puniceibacterium sediminis TaxID=1608407 RepID=A0A238XRV1_9RHOB|nr:DUF3445 domain-containing protein [Puniceibacterium sediminis]SNR61298.1 Protein of unknown function [Puniceibacterium sediminis]
MILQTEIPYDVSHERRLPGVRPLEGDWLLVDDAYGAQMAERARLIARDSAAVHALDDSARPAAEELFDTVLTALPAGFVRDGARVTRPDGVSVTLDRSNPLITLGHLVQEDLCLMLPRDGVHVLAGAILCFPARWRLADKFMRPMVAIHDPVPSYDADIAKRVQRLFDGLQVGRPIWRFNTLWDDDPTLHQPGPRPERSSAAAQVAPYFRSERQCLLRLPLTRAVVFSIHTYVVERAVVEVN